MLALLILSVGLAMDAVAVSLVRGALGERRLIRALEIGAIFGFAQGVMPLIGWALGVVFAAAIAAWDHWIAFGLLSLLGAKMIHEAFADDGEEAEAAATSRWAHFGGLALAAVATSVDAAAAGVTLPLLGLPVLRACLTIGLVTALLCAIAYWLGTSASHRIGVGAQVLGGVILIGLGANILLEHLGQEAM